MVTLGERFTGDWVADRACVTLWTTTCGDAYPMHSDPTAPDSVALGGPIVPGRLKLATLARLLDAWVAGRGRLVRLTGRYCGTDPVGASLVLHGRVSGMSPGRLVVRLWTAGADGRPTTVADAELEWWVG